ncbi:Hexose carrier protein HEX6 [Linum perenne]
MRLIMYINTQDCFIKGQTLLRSVFLIGVAFLTGSAFSSSATNVYILIFGRVLLGIGIGFSNQSVPLYFSKMAPTILRGAINNRFQLSVGISVLAANLINFGRETIRTRYECQISLGKAAGGHHHRRGLTAMRLPFECADFGWGKPIFNRPANLFEGKGNILPKYSVDGNLSLALCLETYAMDNFRKTFYDVNV